MESRLPATTSAKAAALAAAAALTVVVAIFDLSALRIELGLAAILLATRVALGRRRAAAAGHRPEEHREASEIVARDGSDSLAPFALREDKSLHFAAGGFLAYRVMRETAVVSGDPVAPSGRAAAVMASFLNLADRRGWKVIVTGASDRHLDEYAALGLHAMQVGEEAVVDPRSFSLEGRKIRKVRQSVNRVTRQGWTVELFRGTELTPELIAELSRVEAAWRSQQKRLVGFAMTMGRPLGVEEDRESLYVVGRDPDGEVSAFLRFAVFHDGLSLDLMRRSGDEPNGLTEALVVETLQHARDAGVPQVSLNFAGFAHVMMADGALPPLQRALRFALRSLHGRFQLERLVRFNSKFMPEWRPRYLVYRSLSELPLSGLRVLQAEGYLRGPRWLPLRGRWESRAAPPASLAPLPADPSMQRPRPSVVWSVPLTLAILALMVPASGSAPAAATASAGGARAISAPAATTEPAIAAGSGPAVITRSLASGASITRRPAIVRTSAHARRIE